MRKNKLKVMQFIHGLSMGGAETLVKDYVTLCSPEVEMIIVTLERPSKYANERIVRDAGVRVISIPEYIGMDRWFFLAGRALYHYNRKARKDAFIRALKRIIDEEKPDCIHVHLQILHYLLPISESLSGVKLLYTCHSLPELMFAENIEKIAAKTLIKDNYLRMIAINNQMKYELDDMFGVTNTVTVRNGIDLSRFQNVIKRKEDVREELGIAADAYVVGHIGRFTEQKNQRFLVDVFSEIKKLREDAYLLMVGSGEDKETVLSKVNELGLMKDCFCLENRSDIPELLRAMDVFVFPSTFEGLGIVAVEAQAVGIRCIVSEAVPEDVFLTDHIAVCRLDEPASLWAKKALENPFESVDKTGDLSDYDMNEEIKYLEAIYRGEQ